MILPRSHTWMHLLPSCSKFDCRAVPDWFARPLPPGKDDALVIWGNAADDIDLAQSRAVIAINSGRMVAERARRAGLACLRSYAALPDVREPRWFIPLDSPRVADASFSLYTPFRLSAHIKLLLARAAIHVGLPIWYRDTVMVAQRESGPLEVRFQQLFPGERLSLAFSSGALGPDARRKPAVAILARDGRKLAFAKLAGSPTAQALLQHEASVLPALQAMPGGASLTPRLLFAGEIDGRWTLVQSPVEGRHVKPQLTPAHERFLGTLRQAACRPASEIEMVRRLREQVTGIHELRLCLEQVMPILESTPLPRTVTHTDFAPWNLRQTTQGLVAFDWETAELDGLPLYDRWHHELIVGFCIGNWTRRQATTWLAREVQQRPMSLRREQVLALQVVFLVHAVARMLEQGHAPDHEMVQWYWDCLRQTEKQLSCLPRSQPMLARG